MLSPVHGRWDREEALPPGLATGSCLLSARRKLQPQETVPNESQLASSASLEGKGQLKFTSGRWSPHHNCTQVATASDTTLRGWDTRSMSQIYCIENAHGQLVRDLDFNPNKQYYLASCGDDCKVKFWDTRNVTEPVKTLEEHSHWTPPPFLSRFVDTDDGREALVSGLRGRRVRTSTTGVGSRIVL
ncbi:Hypothetical predicted protein [Marmota monax]|uniref:EARP and GARP complex-interacting protein 1 n=1 Tax=Marmota monax TaxID=9995 RepID=A0A5E4C7K0_MARMO|nr:Hypothetical predicted protein [Marmota monax]